MIEFEQFKDDTVACRATRVPEPAILRDTGDRYIFRKDTLPA